MKNALGRTLSLFAKRRAREISTPPQNLQIVILDGQSNMEGRGPIDSEDRLADTDRVFIYTLGGKWMQPAFDPSHTTEAAYGGSQFPIVWPLEKRRGIGSGVAFANKWAELNKGSHPIALLPNARGGKKLSFFLPSDSPISHYVAANARINAAKAHGAILVFLWSQGEADARTIEDASSWADRFEQMAEAWRSEHGATIPIVFAQLGENHGNLKYIHWDVVRQQQALAASRIPNCRMIPTTGLAKDSKGHYTNESYRTIGTMMAQELYDLLN